MTKDLSILNRRKEILRVILSMSIIVVDYPLCQTRQQGVLTYPFELVYISGFFEILGGIGLLIPFVSVAAAWGLLALFIAVFQPISIWLSITFHRGHSSSSIPLLGKAPFQAVLIAWAWWYAEDLQGSQELNALRLKWNPWLTLVVIVIAFQ